VVPLLLRNPAKAEAMTIERARGFGSAFFIERDGLDCVRQKNADAEQSKKDHCEISH